MDKRKIGRVGEIWVEMGREGKALPFRRYGDSPDIRSKRIQGELLGYCGIK
jgi:hypothetical protein